MCYLIEGVRKIDILEDDNSSDSFTAWLSQRESICLLEVPDLKL